MAKISVPKSESTKTEEIEARSLVIIGANGAGKSRLGSKIEALNQNSKRIAGQRSLTIQDTVQKESFHTASSNLYHSYKNHPVTALQSDFPQAMISLFAEEAKRDSDYVKASKASGDKVEVSPSVKEHLLEIWTSLFPHRPLSLDNDHISASNGNSNFPGTEMSDGERVALYLIAQVLLAPPNCLIVIDEPELHLHRALMARLWNKLEEWRSDCPFAYITHDLEFATSKHFSATIWVREFNSGIWKWEMLEPNGIVPEDLFLEILGSRKPVLLIEGERGSLDLRLYQSYYEDLTVIPAPSGSCEKVIESVRGLRGNSALHGKDVWGLIDRDFRSENELKALAQAGIQSIPTKGVENLFLLPEMVELACTHLNKADKKDEVIDKIRDIYDTEKDAFKLMAAKQQIHRALGEEFGRCICLGDFERFKIDIPEIMDAVLVNIALPDKDGSIEEILKVYPRKTLARRIQSTIDLANDGYHELLLSFLSSKERPQIVAILDSYLPSFPPNQA